MDITIIQALIRPELLFIIPVICIIGMFLKSLPEFPDNRIPVALLFFSEVLTLAYVAFYLGNGWTAQTITSGAIQGILIAASAVFGNQLVKQTKKLN